MWRLILFISLFLAPLAVYAASVDVATPNGGECWQAGTQKTLAWTQSENDHVALYYRTDSSTPNYSSDNAGLIAHPVTGTSYNWTVPNTTTSTGKIWVEGHTSGHAQSAIASAAFSIDNASPPAPTLAFDSKTHDTVTLSWNTPTDIGCSGTAGYKLYRNDTQIATITNKTTYTDTGLKASTAYTYKLRAHDNFGHLSGDSSSVTATTSAAPASSATTPTPSPSPSSSPNESPSASPSPQPTEATLGTIKVNDTDVDLKGEVLRVKTGDEVELKGKAAPNATVIIDVYSTKKTHQTTADDQGNWSFVVKTAELSDGDHRVVISAKNQDGSTVPEKEVLKFVSLPEGSSDISIASTQQERAPRWPWIVLGVLVLGGVGGYIYLRKRKKPSPYGAPIKIPKIRR